MRAGEAIYLPAGNLHAYLRGVGVEVMANSDNVLRGGLTPKHVDVPELMRVLDFRPLVDPTVRAVPADRGIPGETDYPTPEPDFALSRIGFADGSAPVTYRPDGPEVLQLIDAVADDFELTHATLTSAGFEHYEVSSYARPGHRSRHNASYWSGAEYLGLGVSAHSLRRLPDGRLERYASPRALQAWTRGVAALTAAPALTDEAAAAALEADPLAELHELLGPRDAAFERVFLGLRTSDGVAEVDLAEHAAALPEMVAAGLITRENGRVCPTPRGMLLGDALALKLG